MKAICSFSGGLDSILAVKLMTEQGIGVEGLYFKTGFGGCGDSEDPGPIKDRADKLGINLTVIDVGEELIKIIKNPKFGFGRNMNPCIDCHSLFFKKCGEYMKRLGCSFIVTGEVVGERPMSQRKWAMRQIDEESELGGLILRPLSAKILDITIPEKEGWVDRTKLLGINGRSRKPQRELAEKYKIGSYPNAAGGCLLTDRDFSKKLKDLMNHKSGVDVQDIASLRLGRHFRFSETVKFVIGRDEKENIKLMERASSKDVCFITVEVPGPVGVLSGRVTKKDELLAASIIAAYSDTDVGDEIEMNMRKSKSEDWHGMWVPTPSKNDVSRFLI